MPSKEIETVCPESRTDWRKWLEKNHQPKQSVWLVFYKKKSKKPTLTWQLKIRMHT